MCSSNDPHSTRYTLLERALDHNDSGAWEELLQHYDRFILYLIQTFNIPVRDHDDVRQNILIHISNNLHTYDRSKGKFRSWCASLIRNQCLMHLRASRSLKATMNAPSGEEQVEVGLSAPEIDKVIDIEWRNYVLKLVRERLATELSPNMLAVFEHALVGRNTAEISELTGFTKNTVYHYQSICKQAFKTATAHILAELGDTE